MALDPQSPTPEPFDPEWDDRLQYWRGKLGRLRLGAEPIAEQVNRHRRVTFVLSAVAGCIALMFVALFTAFGRPDVGLVVVALFLVPIVALAWLDFAFLSLRASHYLRDLRDHQARIDRSKTQGGA